MSVGDMNPGCCGCGGGGITPTPGFSGCCPSNPVPATLTLTFAFGAGTSAATYNNQTQNTTLTYYTSSPPAYYIMPAFGGFTPRYISLEMTDSLGNSFYYDISCKIVGEAGFQTGFPAFGPPASNCGTLAVVACSPFLINGIILGGAGGPTSCFYGTVGGLGVNFGNQAGDNITAS